MKTLIVIGLLVGLYNLLPDGWLIPVALVLGILSYLITEMIAASKNSIGSAGRLRFADEISLRLQIHRKIR